MKLSIIYQYSSDIESLRAVAEQLNGETELLILSVKVGKQLKQLQDGNLDNIKIIKSSSLKTSLLKVQGDYICFICEGDKVADDYIESILKTVTGNEDYIPLKWKFVNWHGFIFKGCGPGWYLFANVYKKDLAIKLDFSPNGSVENFALLAGCICGKTNENVIYKHWRGINE